MRPPGRFLLAAAVTLATLWAACLPNQSRAPSAEGSAAPAAPTPVGTGPSPAPGSHETPAAPPAESRPVAAARRSAEAPPPLAREFRAAWVATVDNIDWPSRKGLPTAEAKAELDAIVDRAAALGLNALVFQVRPAGDAFYESSLEPWSEWLTGAQGKAPSPKWDPLAHVIERCHARGLQLHAWFNPYRASHPAGKSKPAKNHVLVREPGLCVKYGSYGWMDPGMRRSADLFVEVLVDVVRRYDVDGVHIDDYFYPYPENKQDFPDAGSYELYRKAGGKLGRADWRRQNIDRLVERMYDAVHRTKPWVQVGISPFGIARPGVPAGIKAGIDQYGQLYADVPKWLANGWLDYLAPQLYWPIDQAPQSFATLLPWWHQQNTAGRHVWPGINPGRALNPKPPIRQTEIADQIALLRAQRASHGHVHFSFKALRTDAPHVGGALRTLYREPAVAPASPWLGERAPSPLQNAARRGRSGEEVAWSARDDVRFVAVQSERGGRWQTDGIVDARSGAFRMSSRADRIALTPLSRTMVAGATAIVDG
ncbi:MAG: hypothetical protein RL398_1189 [Planctomycetota bacterium]